MALPRFSLYLFLLIGFMSCAGSGTSRAYTKVANEAVKSTLTPNDPNLPYPIYATFEEIETLFNQNDGRTYVINFWATWCPPCIEEIPSMNAAWEKLEPEGIGMLAINAGEGRAAVENFLDKIPIDFPSLLGDSNTLPNWSVRALPTTIVVNANGVVVYQALGPREWDDDELLERIINLL